MRKQLLATVLCAASVLAPTHAFAWGAEGHRLIMRRAIESLPPELKPFFEHNAEEIVLRVNDPDIWRNIPWDDDANHFVDFGMPELGSAPTFPGLPREHGAAVARFGATRLKAIGTLPWRADELSGNLRRAFEGVGQRRGYSLGDVVVFSAVAAHYLQDATQPLHATDNYDGGKTGNQGIHSRFESELVERFGGRLRLSPKAPARINNVREFSFDTLLASNALVAEMLAADKAASAGKDTYDNDYFEKFFGAVQPMLERRLTDAIEATAGLIVSSWEQAGKPTMVTSFPRTPQRVRR